ncbi:MAG: alpha/beta fold hydrolase [Planctomyces sp.]|nr:alpha/beta fold hydrolase [Planctomyces sp.]
MDPMFRAAARRGLSSWLIVLVAAAFAPRFAGGHDPTERNVGFQCDIADVAGTLVIPEADHVAPAAIEGRPPCAVLIGGTLSQTRDGRLMREGAPPREALQRLAGALAEAGYASLRFDRVGYGESRPRDGWSGTYADEARVAAAAIRFVRDSGEFGPIVAIGESAGGYLACLAAQAGMSADAYVFLGAHCGPGEAIYEYNFQPLAEAAESDPELRTWIERDLRFELALGRQFREMFAAAERGETDYELVDGDFRSRLNLARRREELQHPPDEMFRAIAAPALAIAGGSDRNVPPDHAAKIVSRLRQAGNHASTCLVLAGADHSFQLVPDDPDLQFRERHTLDSFRREYDPRLYRELTRWLDRTLKPDMASAAPARPRTIPEPFASRGAAGVELTEPTEFEPARVFLAPGVQLVEEITNAERTAGVTTLEGRIGPLLLAEGCQAHFIDMPGGMYCEEHPHSSESIIYTVRGRWVLCSGGRRWLMKPGTLFHFAANTPTGYEVPFEESAYLLIFKGRRTIGEEREFIEYLQGLAERLEREQSAGVPWLLKDLPDGHSALEFGRSVNPSYDPKAAASGTDQPAP